MEKVSSINAALKKGRSVQIQFTGTRSITGDILAMDKDGLLLKTSGNNKILFVPWTSIETVEIEDIEYEEADPMDYVRKRASQ